MGVSFEYGFSVPVDELLRKLYSLRIDWVVVEKRKKKIVLHKERLISFMGMGLGDSPLEDVLKGKRFSSFEDIPQGEKVLFLDEKGGRIEDFDREPPDAPVTPSWWSVPLPIVKIDGGAELNEKAAALFGRLSLTAKEIKSLGEKGEALLSKGKKRVYLSEIEGPYYLAEDVSGEISMAEDIGWWAAVGRALAERLRREGKDLVRRDRMSQAEVDNELLPCRWENDLLGYLEIKDGGTAGSPSTGDE
jgi:hypothetical protein